MKNILNIITRELKYIFSSRLLVLALLAFPVTDCVFLGGIYISGTLTKLPVAVIDQDNSKFSRTIIRYFNASPDMEVKYRLGSVEELKDLFASHKAVLGVYIPRDLQKNIKKQKPQSITIFTNSSNYITGNIASIDANTIIATLNGGIKYQTLTKKGFSSKQAKELLVPVKNDTAKLFNPSLNYNLYLTPGLWLSVIHQLLILMGTLTIATEFDLKTIRHMLRSAGGSVFKAFAGKTIFYMAVAYLHFEILYRLIFPLFNIPIAYSTAAAMELSMLFAFASLSMGLLLSSVLKTRMNALKGCLVISAPAFLLSGYTWPLDQMPLFLEKLVQLVPLTPFLRGFTKIYQQDLGIEFTIAFAAHLAILGIVLFALAYLIINLRIKKMAERDEF